MDVSFSTTAYESDHNTIRGGFRMGLVWEWSVKSGKAFDFYVAVLRKPPAAEVLWRGGLESDCRLMLTGFDSRR